MKNYKKKYIVAKDLMVDDHIKIAGFLYRVSRVERQGSTIEIELYPIAGGRLTYVNLDIHKERLMKIWNQK
jgi:hypothetical protein